MGKRSSKGKACNLKWPFPSSMVASSKIICWPTWPRLGFAKSSPLARTSRTRLSKATVYGAAEEFVVAAALSTEPSYEATIKWRAWLQGSAGSSILIVNGKLSILSLEPCKWTGAKAKFRMNEWHELIQFFREYFGRSICWSWDIQIMLTILQVRTTYIYTNNLNVSTKSPLISLLSVYPIK